MKTDAWSVSQYEKFRELRAAPFFDLIAMIDRKKRISKAIDLGCGSGELTQILHKSLKSKATVGLDSSDAMLNSARKFEQDGLSFEKGNIEGAIEAGKYDLIFSNAALQWCNGHEALFEELRKGLRAGGQLAVQMPMNHDYPTHLCADRLARTEPYRTWLKGDSRASPLLTPEKYSELLFRLGYAEQKVILKVYGHVLPSREKVIEWVKGTLLTYYEARFSPEQYAVFLAHYREELFKIISPERPFFYPFKRILIWARAGDSP